jgi:hypothetical protein
LPIDALAHYHLAPGNLPARLHENGHIAQGIASIDSIPNFNGKYQAEGFDLYGAPNKQWVYNIVGNLPQHGGVTTIRAPIVPVSVDLLGADGSTLFHVDATQYAQQALNSPIFQNASYSSSGVPLSLPTPFNGPNSPAAPRATGIPYCNPLWSLESRSGSLMARTVMLSGPPGLIPGRLRS